MDFHQFAALMEQRASDLPLRVNEIKKQAASILVTRLVYNTPVDTSQALSNYLVGINSPVRYMVPARVPGTKGSTAAASSAQTIQDAESVIAMSLPGDEIYVTNSADYILDLEDGYSPQAPDGMIDNAMSDAREYLKGVKLLGE